MITKIIIDGQEFNTPARNFKFKFTTAVTYEVEYITNDGIVPASLVEQYKDTSKVSWLQWTKQILPIPE